MHASSWVSFLPWVNHPGCGAECAQVVPEGMLGIEVPSRITHTLAPLNSSLAPLCSHHPHPAPFWVSLHPQPGATGIPWRGQWENTVHERSAAREWTPATNRLRSSYPYGSCVAFWRKYVFYQSVLPWGPVAMLSPELPVRRRHLVGKGENTENKTGKLKGALLSRASFPGSSLPTVSGLVSVHYLCG